MKLKPFNLDAVVLRVNFSRCQSKSHFFKKIKLKNIVRSQEGKNTNLTAYSINIKGPNFDQYLLMVFDFLVIMFL